MVHAQVRLLEEAEVIIRAQQLTIEALRANRPELRAAPTVRHLASNWSQVALHDVCLSLGCDVTALTGRSRLPRVVALRKRAIERLHDAGLSSTEIGQLLHRDHTTVLHALGRTSKSR